jgi:antitoxin ParD1/3/4
MSRETSVSLSDHFAAFLDAAIKDGRYSSEADVVSAGLRLLEEEEAKLVALRAALIEGEASGPSMPFDFGAFIATKRDASRL